MNTLLVKVMSCSARVKTAFLILAFLCFWTNFALAQEIFPLTRSVYYPDNLIEYQQNGSFAQDHRGTIYIGFSAGLVEFDGRNKALTATKSPVLELKYAAQEQTLWAACQKSAGYFSRAADGSLRYRPLKVNLPDSVAADHFEARIFDLQKQVVFYYPDYALVYDKESKSAKSYLLKRKGRSALGAFEHKGAVYVNMPGSGLNKFSLSGLQPLANNDALNFRKIIDYLPLGGDSLLIATSDSKLFYFDGAQAAEFESDLNYAVSSANDRLTGLVEMDGYYLAATEQNGCLAFEKSTGKVISAINTRYNLADNNINAIFRDKAGRVWMAHNEQISWAYLNYPIQEFKKGLTGSVNDLVSFERNLYVATDDGVYYFTRFSNFDMANERLLDNIIGQFEKVELPDASQVKTKPLPDYSSEIQQINESYEQKVEKIEKKDEGVSGVTGKTKGLVQKQKEKGRGRTAGTAAHSGNGAQEGRKASRPAGRTSRTRSRAAAQNSRNRSAARKRNGRAPKNQAIAGAGARGPPAEKRNRGFRAGAKPARKKIQGAGIV